MLPFLSGPSKTDRGRAEAVLRDQKVKALKDLNDKLRVLFFKFLNTSASQHRSQPESASEYVLDVDDLQMPGGSEDGLSGSFPMLAEEMRPLDIELGGPFDAFYQCVVVSMISSICQVNGQCEI